MSAVSSMGLGGGLSHLQLLQGDPPRDENVAVGHAAQQTETATTVEDKTAASETDSQAAQATSQDDVLAKINALIDNEQNAGRLSSNRASALRNVFANAFAGKPDGTDSAAGKATGQTSTASALAPQAAAASNQTSASQAAATTSAPDVGSILNDFLKLLQDAKSTASTYGASGNAGSNAATGNARLINYRA